VGRVSAAIRRGVSTAELDMRITRRPAAAGADASTRATLVDGKERPARALLGLCPVVLFWPDDLQLVKGAPEGRRRLLDVVLSQLDPVAADDLLRYRRALEQRNALLRQVRQGVATPAALPQFTDELVRHGGAVRVHRARLVERLSPLAAEAMRELSGGG
jgi:DNA replication and repair protein RecF